jgi:hypothetical protein
MEADYVKLAFALVIVMGVVASEMFRHYIKAKQGQGSGTLTAMESENRVLKKRIEVLEELVTDDGFELKQQFKQL